jgi:hypothetical protein
VGRIYSRTRADISTYAIFIGAPEYKMSLGISKHRSEDNIKTDDS